MKREWYKQKTTWSGIAAIVAGIGGLITGDMESSTAFQMIFTGAIGIFLRQGIEKNGGS
jgi:hypothetical protein